VLTLFIILVAWSAVTDPFEWRTPFVVGAGLYIWWRVLNLGIDLEKARNRTTLEGNDGR